MTTVTGGHGTALRRLGADLGEMLARHDRGRDIASFARWAEDPVGFVRDVLRDRDPGPWEAQVRIAEGVRDAPLVVVRSCNAAGKDWISARLALWWAYARRGLVLVTGPTERQVRGVAMGELARAWRQAPDLPGELFASALRLGGSETAGVLAFTSTEASRLTGFHAPRLLALLTEAQGVEPFAWEGLLACATGAEDRVLAVGNPLAPTGTFYRVSRPGSGWEALRIAGSDVPNVREGRVVIPGLLTRQGVERIRSMYGKGSPIFTARVEGEFPDVGEQGMFRRSWLEAAAERWPSWREKHATDWPTIAVDPARYGPDSTVCAVVRGPVVEELVGWHGADLMESVERVRELADRLAGGPRVPGQELGWYTERGHWRTLPRPRIRVDEVGVGSGLLDRLREVGLGGHGFNGGCRATDPRRFANLRAESYWSLRDRLAAGQIALPRDEKLFAELLATTWAPTANGKVQVVAKDEIRAKLGRSPDRADAVMMALAPVARGLRRRVLIR